MWQYCDQPEEWGMTVGYVEEHWNQTFLWKIGYFFMLPQEEDFCLRSPVFYFAGCPWYLELYPNGERKHFSRGCFGLYVRQCSGNLLSNTFEAGILTVFRKIEFREKEELWFSGITKFLLRRHLFERREECLPGDILTIWIHFKHEVPRSKPSSKSIQGRERRLEALRAYNMFKEELSLGVNEASVWQKMAAAVRKKYSLSKGDYDLPQFHSQMHSLKREYERKRNLNPSVTGPAQAMFLKEAQLAFEDVSKISVKRTRVSSGDHTGKDVQKEHGGISEHEVKRMRLSSGDYSSKDVQKEDSYGRGVKRRLNSGNHSGEDDQKDNSEHAVKRPRLHSGNYSGEVVQQDFSEHGDLTLLSDHFRELFFDKECSDVIIDVEGKTIQAHKMVLKVRSKELFSMLKNSSAEEKMAVIKIEDCELEAFEIFLLYLYTAKVEELSATNMLDLYDIAVKFNAPGLKAKCLKYIKHSMTVENVCSVIQVARKHKDSELLKFATDYFLENVNATMEILEQKS